MNNTISVGGKIAGVTSVEGVVPSSKNPNEVSKVTKTLSNGNTTEHTVFSNTLGDLYAKDPFGTTFSVTQNSNGSFTAGGKTPKGMPTDAQPNSIFSGLLSGLTKSKDDPSKDASSTSIGGPAGSPQRSSPSQSPRGSGSVPDRGGNGSGNGNNSGSGPSFGVDGFSMNKGGLAGKKPKKKMKTYKKGGLATSKK
jgi:hypothetical protein